MATPIARQTIQLPGNRFMGPTTNDATEHGANYADFMTAADSNFKELFQRTGGDTALAASGLVPQQIPLPDGMTTAGVFLTATPGSGAFGVSQTLGTSIGLTGESTSASSKTDDVVFDYVLPPTYVAGQNVTVTANALQQGAGTVTVKTIQALAYKVANDGTMGADVIGAAAQNLTTASADYGFTIPGTGLTPGTHLMLRLTTVITTSSGAANAKINSVRVS